MNGTHERCRCPVDAFQHMISGKYKLRLIWDLQNGPLRYGELKKNLAALVPGSKEITARVLSRELKALAANGLIERTDHGTVPPKVEYALSPLGRSLIPVIDAMQVWGTAHLVATLEMPAG
jgi:DNA-binding HxlR family transcriptional regulator